MSAPDRTELAAFLKTQMRNAQAMAGRYKLNSAPQLEWSTKAEMFRDAAEALAPQAAPMPGVKADNDLLDQAVAFAEMWGTEDNWQHVRDAYVAAILRERSALATPEAGTSEPVAWRWRFSNETVWQISSEDPTARLSSGPIGRLASIEPLYTHPAPAQAPVDREAVRALRETASEIYRQAMLEAQTLLNSIPVKATYKPAIAVDPDAYKVSRAADILREARHAVIFGALAAAPSARKEP